ncbi:MULTISPECIES: APC family permease [Streptomyces]|uniref:APC family permease n=1 Tax=Streptomyces TaxID=1883 RepID=UPI001E4D7870|nr:MULTISPECIES: APC family permease [Streptomyces]UFQ13938.1 APC family permease [Streptomyces huasconensis]WCL83538.1 APC family permease [Streptomyces sp. JCM 35825]
MTAPPSSAPPPPPTASSRGLRDGAVGTGDLVFFVVAAAAPLTVMAGVAPLAIGMAGRAAPLGYLLSGLLLIVFAAGFTAMSRFVRNAGAFYAYIGKGIGRPMGAGAAYVALFSYNAIEVGLLAAFGWFTEAGFEDLTGTRVPWWLWSLGGLVAIGVLGYLKVTLSAGVLGTALVLEVLVLLAFEAGVLAHGGGPQGLGLGSLSPTRLGESGVGGMFVLAIGAFVGFEATAIYAEEARRPERTVPRATYVAVAFLALFYTFTVWMIINAYGSQSDRAQEVANGKGGADMVFTATERFTGGWAADSMHVLIITSTFAATLAFHNGAARYFYALGRENLLPARLGTVSAKTRAPAAAVVTQSATALAVIVATVVGGADPYSVTFLWSNGSGILGVMLMQALAALAVHGFFRRDRRAMPAWRVVAAPLVACAGLAVMIVLVCAHLDLLTGASAGVNAALILPLPVLFGAGVALALRIKRRDPASYERLTTLDAERL